MEGAVGVDRVEPGEPAELGRPGDGRRRLADAVRGPLSKRPLCTSAWKVYVWPGKPWKVAEVAVVVVHTSQGPELSESQIVYEVATTPAPGVQETPNDVVSLFDGALTSAGSTRPPTTLPAPVGPS